MTLQQHKQHSRTKIRDTNPNITQTLTLKK